MAVAGGRPRQPNDPSVLSSLESALRSARPNLLVVIWRWRYELALALGLPAAAIAVARGLGTVWLVATVVTLTAGFGLWPPGRRLLVKRAWCVITPHRLRTGCAHSWIQSRSGKLPIILFTTPQPFGERVLLWCVAGVTAEDLIAAKDLLIAACWATDMRISRSERHAHIVLVDVIRHPQTSPRHPEMDRLSWPA
jgi:hypothetical protein